MSIVLVVFPAAPKPSPEAQRADRELDETLRARLTGCYYSLLHSCAPHSHTRASPHPHALTHAGHTPTPNLETYRSSSNDARG